MTAIFDVAYHEGAFILLLPKSRAQAALDRLKKYVLRSRVVFTLDTETCLMKAWGAANDAPPLNSLHALFTGIHHRVYVVDQARLEGLHARTDRLSESQARLNEFRAQWAYLGSATEEVFIPQMLNLDETGGISFKKGCYTGQEIVARTHYLGRVKRRMALFQFRAECPEVGTKIETSAWGGLTVVDAIRGEGPWGYLLAVLAGSDEQ
jgi:folate-binding protein YgfZ